MSPSLIFDLIVIAALLISALISFFRGFIRETLTIFGVVGGLLAAYWLGPALSPLIEGWLGVVEGEEPEKLFDIIPYPVLADALAYGGIFIIVVIVLSIISHYLAGWAKALGLGAIDRTFGVMFGIVRGVVLLGLLYILPYLMTDSESRAEYLEGSKTRVYIEATASYMASLIPESLNAALEDRAGEVGGLADTTRERLQELELLRDTQPAPAEQETVPAQDGENGYRHDERRDLDRLFEGSITND